MIERVGSELKRRRVLRAAVLYVIAAWLALQVAEVLSEAGLPPGFVRYLLAVLVALFPIVIVIGWYFDITRDGIRRTAARSPGEEQIRFAFFDYVQLAGVLLALSLSIYVLTTHEAPDEALAIAVLGFQDAETTDDQQFMGEVLADEIRRMLAVESGLKIIGPATTSMLRAAGQDRFVLSKELAIYAFLDGDVGVSQGVMSVQARIVRVSDRRELWSTTFERPTVEALQIQRQIVDAVMAALGATLPAQSGTRTDGAPDDCAGIYDVYLQARRLVSSPPRSEAHARGIELLENVVAQDPDCAVAWEALAGASVDWTDAGFAKAGAAARRALELNPRLPGAWAVLAEIAEQEQRWIDAETYFLRALDIDPADSGANAYYAETLMARGRVSDARRYALKAYEADPASRSVNFKVAAAASMSGDYDLAIKHLEIADRLSSDAKIKAWVYLAGTYIRKGDNETALVILRRHEDMVPPFTERCLKARDDPALATGLMNEIRATNDAIVTGEITGPRAGYYGELLVQCVIWIGAADFIVGELSADDVLTEARWLFFFDPEATVFRQHPGFREMVIEDGLLDYWRKIGWSDYCEPVGEDDFRCD
ncbi:MAG: tetratricopeptide repeat protein [Gammaproteobacteria bacterium]|nr:MAG: tetratricopeptide repeat protein [Gammaproteobacteria bacterium]